MRKLNSFLTMVLMLVASIGVGHAQNASSILTFSKSTYYVWEVPLSAPTFQVDGTLKAADGDYDNYFISDKTNVQAVYPATGAALVSIDLNKTGTYPYTGVDRGLYTGTYDLSALTTAGSYTFTLKFGEGTDVFISSPEKRQTLTIETIDPSASFFGGNWTLPGGSEEYMAPNSVYYAKAAPLSLRFCATLVGEILAEKIRTEDNVYLRIDKDGVEGTPFIYPTLMNDAEYYTNDITLSGTDVPTEPGVYSVNVLIKKSNGDLMPTGIDPFAFTVYGIDFVASSFKSLIPDYYYNDIPADQMLQVELKSTIATPARVTGRTVLVKADNGNGTTVDIPLTEQPSGNAGLYKIQNQALADLLPDAIGTYTLTVFIDGEEVTTGGLIDESFKVFDYSQSTFTVPTPTGTSPTLADYFVFNKPTKSILRIVLNNNVGERVNGKAADLQVQLVDPLGVDVPGALYDGFTEDGSGIYRYTTFTDHPVDPLGEYTFKVLLGGEPLLVGDPLEQLVYTFTVDNVNQANAGDFSTNINPDNFFEGKGKIELSEGYFGDVLPTKMNIWIRLKSIIGGANLNLPVTYVITDASDVVYSAETATIDGAATHNPVIADFLPTDAGDYVMTAYLNYVDENNLGYPIFTPIPFTVRAIDYLNIGTKFELEAPAGTPAGSYYYIWDLPAEVKAIVGLVDTENDAVTGRDVKTVINGGMLTAPEELDLTETPDGTYTGLLLNPFTGTEQARILVGTYTGSVTIDGGASSFADKTVIIDDVDYGTSVISTNINPNDFFTGQGKIELPAGYCNYLMPTRVNLHVNLKSQIGNGSTKNIVGAAVTYVIQEAGGGAVISETSGTTNGSGSCTLTNQDASVVLPSDAGDYELLVYINYGLASQYQIFDAIAFTVYEIDYVASTFATSILATYEPNTALADGALTVTLVNTKDPAEAATGRVVTVEQTGPAAATYTLTETADGVYEWTVSPLPVALGDYTLTVYVDGVATPLEYTFTVYPNKVNIPANKVLLRSNPTRLVKGQDAVITVTVLDASNQPIVTPNYNIEVKCTVGPSSSNYSLPHPLTNNGDGTYNTTFNVSPADVAKSAILYLYIDGKIYSGTKLTITLTDPPVTKALLQGEGEAVSATNAYVVEKSLIVEAAQSSVLTVYTAAGKVQLKQNVAEGTTTITGMQSGFYIVNVDGKTFKVIVK